MIRQNKYNRAPVWERTTPAGIVFDSKAEMLRWYELQMLERTGKISDIVRQPKFPLIINGVPVIIQSTRYKNGRKCVYTADFAYTENGERIIEDVKGVQTQAATLRMAVAEAIYGFKIKITGAAAR